MSYSLKSTTISGSLALGEIPAVVNPTPVFNLSQVGESLRASATQNGGKLTYSISLSSNQVLIGCPFIDHAGKVNAGAVFMFKYENGSWVETNVFHSSSPQDNGHFGFSVSLADTTFLVGAPGEDNQAGAVYGWFFENRQSINDWIPCTTTPRIVASDVGVETDGNFGFSISSSNQVAVIGSPQAHSGSGRFGAAYSLRYHGLSQRWEHTGKLTAPTTDGSVFGSSVCLDGDTMIAVGAPMEDVSYGGVSPHAGAVYIFGRTGDTWARAAKIIHPTGQNNGEFGHSIDLTGGRLLVGAPGWDGIGSAFVFGGYWDSWSFVSPLFARVSGGTITDSQVSTGDRQGSCVCQDIINNVLYVGSPNHLTAGCVYVYEISNNSYVGAQTNILEPQDLTSGDRFGQSLDAISNMVVVGSPDGSLTGKWYVFKH